MLEVLRASLRPDKRDLVAAPIYQFADFCLDCGRFELLRKGRPLRMERKPMELLILLVARQGQLVTRAEIAQHLWSSEVFVDTEHGINTAIRKIRYVLRDDPDEPRILQTVTGKGYKIVCPVETTERHPDIQALPNNTTSPTPQQRRSRIHNVLLYGFLALLVVLLAALAFQGPFHGAPPSAADSSRPVTEKRLTTNPPEVPLQAAAISPDGKYVSYADPTGLYLRQISTGETRRWNLPKDFVVGVCSWYPDGAHLLVTRIKGPVREFAKWDPSLYKLSILCGEPREIMPNAASGSVSPDGSRIAYLSARTADQLWVMRSDGTDPRKVATVEKSAENEAPGSWIHPVAWSPTGRHLVYIESHNVAGPLLTYPRRTLRIIDVTGKTSKVALADQRIDEALA